MGEAKFGLIDGVLSSYAGWLGKVEVVFLEFDPEVVSYATLVEQSRKHDCATHAFPMNDKQLAVAQKTYGENAKRFEGEIRRVEDTMYYLKKTPLRFLPMTPLQTLRINSKPAEGDRWLSPSQRELLAFIEAHPDAGWKEVVGQPFEKAWKKVQERRQVTSSGP